jgi:lysine 2,3-aminomutase
VQPQRVTPALARILKRYHPLWMSLHFTHPDELTPEVAEACSRLADAGIPLGSQTVLLQGQSTTTWRPCAGLSTVCCASASPLLPLPVRPHHRFAHFRTPVEKGLEIIRGLRGHTTGYAVPTYVIDAPDGGGKIPLSPDYLAGRDGDDLLLTNYAGGQYRYPDPVPYSSPDLPSSSAP